MMLQTKKSARKPLKISSIFTCGEEDEEDDNNMQEAPMDTTSESVSNVEIDYFAEVVALQEDGCEKAEAGDSWGALSIWGKALGLLNQNIIKRSVGSDSEVRSDLDLNYRCAMLHELKAQVLMDLELLVKACHEAHCSVNYVPCWAVSRQTLARCQREMGEIFLSLETYKVARTLSHKQCVRNHPSTCYVCDSSDCESALKDFLPSQGKRHSDVTSSCNCNLDVQDAQTTVDEVSTFNSSSSSGNKDSISNINDSCHNINSSNTSDNSNNDDNSISLSSASNVDWGEYMCNSDLCREICSEGREVESLSIEMQRQREVLLAPLQLQEKQEQHQSQTQQQEPKREKLSLPADRHRGLIRSLLPASARFTGLVSSSTFTVDGDVSAAEGEQEVMRCKYHLSTRPITYSNHPSK